MPCKSVVAKSTSTNNICIRGKTSMGVSSNCMYNNVLMFLFFFINFSFAVDNFSSFQSVSDGTTLVSKNEMFEFGFFSLGSSKNRYVGIWYKNIPVQTVVWVANRCNPVNDSSGLLTINSTGNLVLLYQNKSVVWSTKLSKKVKKPLVQILDSGNLVLKDEEDRNSEDYLWQSFDNPSNTLLPGMKLGWDLRRGLNRRVSAWRNWDDPCPGDFTWGVEFNAKYQASPEAYTWKGGAKYHRSGPWNGLRFSGVPELRPNQLFDFRVVHNEDEVYYLFDLRNDSVNSILVMNQTTSTRERFTWIEAEKRWKLYSSEPRDLCDKYGLCGGNGDCVIGENPVCQCFKGFKPKFEEKWNLTDWSDGCTRSNPLDCTDKSKDGFIKSVGLKMPDIENSRGNESMNLKECRAKCLSNCSCMAYANSDIRGDGSGCIMWFGDLMDIRKVPYDEQVLYLRMPASELGKSGPKMRAVIVVVASIGGVAGVLLLGHISYRTKSKAPRENPEETDDLELPLFDLATIAKATNNFSTDNKLGQGGFGPVYKGKLNDGQEIAVKRLSGSSGQGLNEFKNEVILIAKLQHRNLVRLTGYCIQGEEKLLIYEYMPNKSLDFFIFGETRKKLLDWSRRFQIICGIARGLLYLHQDSRLRIIQRDLKAGNVLLDDELNPKISDFGMAKTFGGNQTEGNTNRVVGTYGYMAPEYASDGLFSIKSDVFSFGILVLEIVSGKKNSGFFHQDDSLNLTGHAWRLWNEGNALELIDECLVGSRAESEMLRCIQIGLLCIQHRPEDRPSMSSVVVMFGSQSSLAQPKQPGFFTENAQLKRDVVHSSSSNTQDSSSKNEVTVTLLVPR